MTEQAPDNSALWEALAAPFPAEDIERLPKPLRRDDDRKARCEDSAAGRTVSADGHFCGGWHSRAVHLDYVGHAGITTRLNETVGPENWSYEPYAQTPDGVPLMTTATFYGRLTVLGVTKWDVAADFKGPQEAYGDCLRRCAMRFGIGTYLWSKSERAQNRPSDPPPVPAGEKPDITTLMDRANLATTEDELLSVWQELGAWNMLDEKMQDGQTAAQVVQGLRSQLTGAGA